MLIIILLFIAGILTGINRIIYKSLAIRGHSSTTYTTVSQLTGAIFAVPLLFVGFHVPSNPEYWLLVIVSVTAYAFCLAFLFRAYKYTDVSRVSIIERLNIVFVAIIGIVFLREQHSVISLLGLILIFFGGLIVVFEKNGLTLEKGVIYAIISTLLGAVATVLDKIILREFSPYTYVFVNDVLVGSIFVFRKGFLPDAKKLITTYSLPLMVTSAMGTISFAIVLTVMQRTDVSFSMPIYKSFSLITPVLLGVLLLKETGNLVQKITGSLLAVSGIFLLYAAM